MLLVVVFQDGACDFLDPEACVCAPLQQRQHDARCVAAVVHARVQPALEGAQLKVLQHRGQVAEPALEVGREGLLEVDPAEEDVGERDAVVVDGATAHELLDVVRPVRHKHGPHSSGRRRRRRRRRTRI